MGISESDLRPGEKILYVVRHHGLFLFWPLVVAMVFMAGPWVVGAVFETGQSPKVNFIIMAFGLPWIFKQILVLQTDVWVITDRRLIDRTGIISRTVKESPFEKIHNATYKQGILGRIFDFGDIQVQTASTEGFSKLSMVKDPRRVCKVLMEAVDADIENRPPNPDT